MISQMDCGFVPQSVFSYWARYLTALSVPKVPTSKQ